MLGCWNVMKKERTEFISPVTASWKLKVTSMMSRNCVTNSIQIYHLCFPDLQLFQVITIYLKLYTYRRIPLPPTSTLSIKRSSTRSSSSSTHQPPLLASYHGTILSIIFDHRDCSARCIRQWSCQHPPRKLRQLCR